MSRNCDRTILLIHSWINVSCCSSLYHPPPQTRSTNVRTQCFAAWFTLIHLDSLKFASWFYSLYSQSNLFQSVPICSLPSHQVSFMAADLWREAHGIGRAGLDQSTECGELGLGACHAPGSCRNWRSKESRRDIRIRSLNLLVFIRIMLAA